MLEGEGSIPGRGDEFAPLKCGAKLRADCPEFSLLGKGQLTCTLKFQNYIAHHYRTINVLLHSKGKYQGNGLHINIRQLTAGIKPSIILRRFEVTIITLSMLTASNIVIHIVYILRLHIS